MKSAAELLHHRLFATEEKVQEFLTSIRERNMYSRHSVQFEKVFGYKNHELQRWVRSSFMSAPESKRAAAFQDFITKVVEPCMSCNVTVLAKSKPAVVQAQAMFEKYLASGQLSDMEQVNMSLANACLVGKLSNHPLIQGLLLSCLKKIEREEAGMDSRGRNRASSALAVPQGLEIARQAGRDLAILGGSAKLLKAFGVAKTAGPNLFEQLDKAGLPNPVLSLAIEGRVQENMRLIDHMLAARTKNVGCTSAERSTDLLYYIHEVFEPCNFLVVVSCLLIL